VQPNRAAVLRVDFPPHEARLLEGVDHGGDRPRGDAEVVGELRHPRRLLAARDHPQRAFLSRGETERRESLRLRTTQPPRQPLQQVSELRRVLVLRPACQPKATCRHALDHTRRPAHTELGTIMSYTLFELSRLNYISGGLIGYR
jgi:hypothetical protein